MNMKFAVIALALGVAFWAPQPAWAQETKAELAREVMVLMDVEATLVDMMDTLAPIIAGGSVNDLELTPSEEGRLTELLREEFRNGTPSMVGRIAEAFAEHISEADLRNIRDFLRTPSGQAMVATQGQLDVVMEREGQQFGMRVALQAFTRLMEERNDAK